MNKARRKEIARAVALLEEAKTVLETAESDERDYFDAMPESFQQGDKGTAAEAAADALQESVDAIGEAVEALERAVE